MSDEVIGGPCTYGCGDVPGHPGICLVTKLKPSEDDLKAKVERLEHRVSDLGAFVQAAVKEMRQAAPETQPPPVVHKGGWKPPPAHPQAPPPPPRDAR